MTEHTSTAADHSTVDARPSIADTFGTLAVCWREPSEDWVDAIESGRFEWLEGVETFGDLDELRVEYTRLFIGPGRDQCPPYESVYRDGEDSADLGPVYGPTTQAVARWYDEYDLRLRDSRSAPPDHIATELEFAAYLSANEADSVLEQFLNEHPREWVGQFVAHLRENDPGPFYRALIQRTTEAINP